MTNLISTSMLVNLRVLVTIPTVPIFYFCTEKIKKQAYPWPTFLILTTTTTLTLRNIYETYNFIIPRIHD